MHRWESTDRQLRSVDFAEIVSWALLLLPDRTEAMLDHTYKWFCFFQVLQVSLQCWDTEMGNATKSSLWHRNASTVGKQFETISSYKFVTLTFIYFHFYILHIHTIISLLLLLLGTCSFKWHTEHYGSLITNIQTFEMIHFCLCVVKEEEIKLFIPPFGMFYTISV